MAKQKETTKKQGGRVKVNTLPKSEEQSTTGEGWKKWSQLVAQAWADEKLKQRLIDNPAKVLKEHGMEVPAGVEIRVVENTEKVKFLTLPTKPPGELMELDASQMRAVVGGVEPKASAGLKPSPGTGRPYQCFGDKDYTIS